ncbi:MAG: rRNA pseudouridine synthase [Deltaproteobacteria bacterium]|nr:rRNA pseudouridine synthase [Deltaproteobacteria bacterium]
MDSARSRDSARLDRFLAHAMGISRTDGQRLVRRGHVTVDGELASNPSAHVSKTAFVEVNGKEVALPGRTVLVFHKPAGFISATRDERERTVIDALPRDLAPALTCELLLVGRLDKDATGLLILTNDGALVHRLTHPKRHVPRTYALTWEGTLVPDAVARVQAGLPIDEGDVCLPAELVIDDANHGHMTMHQGMFHQVKRMIAALGGVVTRLHRISFGPIVLGDLPQGAVRILTEAEVATLLASAVPAA